MSTTLQLKLMSFNIQHGKGMDGKVDLSRIADTILKSGADVVGLQEVDRYLFRSGFQDQAERLAVELNMNWCHAPSLRLGFMRYGNMVLSRYPIVRHDVKLMAGFGERRSILAADIGIGANMIRVINTHLGLLPWQRRKQMAILLGTLATTEGPSILMGDFNMEADHPLLHCLQDSWSKLKLHMQQATNRFGGEIDHIFVNRPVVQSRTWVEPTVASDHNPVLSDLRLLTDMQEELISQTAN